MAARRDRHHRGRRRDGTARRQRRRQWRRRVRPRVHRARLAVVGLVRARLGVRAHPRLGSRAGRAGGRRVDGVADPRCRRRDHGCGRDEGQRAARRRRRQRDGRALPVPGRRPRCARAAPEREGDDRAGRRVPRRTGGGSVGVPVRGRRELGRGIGVRALDARRRTSRASTTSGIARWSERAGGRTTTTERYATAAGRAAASSVASGTGSTGTSSAFLVAYVSTYS